MKNGKIYTYAIHFKAASAEHNTVPQCVKLGNITLKKFLMVFCWDLWVYHVSYLEAKHIFVSSVNSLKLTKSLCDSGFPLFSSTRWTHMGIRLRTQFWTRCTWREINRKLTKNYIFSTPFHTLSVYLCGSYCFLFILRGHFYSARCLTFEHKISK